MHNIVPNFTHLNFLFTPKSFLQEKLEPKICSAQNPSEHIQKQRNDEVTYFPFRPFTFPLERGDVQPVKQWGASSESQEYLH